MNTFSNWQDESHITPNDIFVNQWIREYVPEFLRGKITSTELDKAWSISLQICAFGYYHTLRAKEYERKYCDLKDARDDCDRLAYLILQNFADACQGSKDSILNAPAADRIVFIDWECCIVKGETTHRIMLEGDKDYYIKDGDKSAFIRYTSNVLHLPKANVTINCDRILEIQWNVVLSLDKGHLVNFPNHRVFVQGSDMDVLELRFLAS